MSQVSCPGLTACLATDLDEADSHARVKLLATSTRASVAVVSSPDNGDAYGAGWLSGSKSGRPGGLRSSFLDKSGTNVMHRKPPSIARPTAVTAKFTRPRVTTSTASTRLPPVLKSPSFIPSCYYRNTDVLLSHATYKKPNHTNHKLDLNRSLRSSQNFPSAV